MLFTGNILNTNCQCYINFLSLSIVQKLDSLERKIFRWEKAKTSWWRDEHINKEREREREKDAWREKIVLDNKKSIATYTSLIFK